MLKKRIKKIICFLSVVVIAFSSFLINSSAAQNSSNTYKISSARPSDSQNNGYVEVLLKNSNGDTAVRVFSWNLYKTNAQSYDLSEAVNNKVLKVQVKTSKSIEFSVFSSAEVGFWVTSFYSIANNNNYEYRIIQSDGSYTYTTENYSIVSVHCYGSGLVTTSVALSEDEFYVIYSDEVIEYNQLLSVISIINQLAENDQTIISKLQTIINNTDTIETKLQSALNLLTTIETDLDDVNAELDRIESNTDDLEKQLETIINILDNKEQSTPKPDTSTTDDYSAKEEALIGGTAAGREEANTVFTDFNTSMSDNVGRGLLAVTAIFKEFTNISWLDSLIKFSLALGVFGFILGMGFFLVSSAAGKEARSERKEANKLRTQYYKSGIERNNSSIDYYNSRGK